MLVCSVSLRPKRGTLAASITETATAIDAPSINAVFAILADVPGTASDYLDAFVGKRMVEPASAVDVVDAIAAYPAVVVEEISAAIASQNATIGGVIPVSPRQSMVDTGMINSDGTARQANAAGTMINL